MTNFDVDLGQRIRVLRQAQGVTQRTMADQVGMIHQSISHIETGRQSVSVENLSKIAAFLGVPISSFFEEVPDAASEVAELRGRLLTAQYHLRQAVKVLGDD